MNLHTLIPSLHSPRRGRTLPALLGLFFASFATIATAQTTYQAETGALSGATPPVVETTNGGFNGAAYINMLTNTSTLTLSNVTGNGGGTKNLAIRYALGAATSRSCNLTVNGSTQTITFTPTGAWTTWTTLNVIVTLNNNTSNIIAFTSTGSDAGNIDEITVPAGGGGLIQVPKWKPQDFSFVSATPPSNPFSATFSAVASGPGGASLTLLGFYDGGNTWKIRFSPTVFGNWTLTTTSSVADLNNKTASLSCVANASNVHGGIKVDASHPHNFVFEDGTRWYPMGYEADWLWALDLANASSLARTAPFLDKIAASGFNFVLLQAYAHDTTWRSGTTAADDYGPPAMYAFGGTNAAPDHSRMNVTYWQRYDRVIDALYQRGIVAHLMIKVYNKGVTWPVNASSNDNLFFRYLIARYAAYPNITWDLAKEANNEASTSYKTGRLTFIRTNDPYKRLVTVHTDDSPYNAGTYNGLADYRSAQEEQTWHAPMKTYLGQRQWPVINVEFGYECGPGGLSDRTYSHVSLPKEVARRAWEVCTTGAFCAYYYTYTAWDVVRPTDTPPGYAYMKNLRTFFEETQYWLMNSADNLVTGGGYCLANPGKEYIVFHNAATTFTLTIAGASGPLNAEWYEPYSGARASAGALSNGARTLTPPSSLGTGPIALHVGTPTSGNPGVVANGTYAFINRLSGQSLDVFGSRTADGTNVDQYPYGGGTHQQWNVTSLGGGQYSIIGVDSGKALEVAGASTADGANVDILTYTGATNQRWTFTPTTGGYYSVTAVHSNKVLEVAGASLANGANVDQSTSTGGDHQQWILQAP